MKELSKLLAVMGADPRRFFQSLGGVPKYLRDMRAYKAAGRGLPLVLREMIPVLANHHGQAGSTSGHYWHQDIWAAREIHRCRPARHVDISSRMDGLVSHLLAF